MWKVRSQFLKRAKYKQQKPYLTRAPLPSCPPWPPLVTLLSLPLPPHLLLFPLWPASVVCLGWLIIRDTKILLSPLLFSPLKRVTSLPGPWFLDSCQEIPCYLLPCFHPRRGEPGKAFSEESTQKPSVCIHTNTNPPTVPQKDTEKEKPSMLQLTHTSWPGFKHPTGPRTRSPWIPRLMFVPPPELLACLP